MGIIYLGWLCQGHFQTLHIWRCMETSDRRFWSFCREQMNQMELCSVLSACSPKKKKKTWFELFPHWADGRRSKTEITGLNLCCWKNKIFPVDPPEYKRYIKESKSEYLIFSILSQTNTCTHTHTPFTFQSTPLHVFGLWIDEPDNHFPTRQTPPTRLHEPKQWISRALKGWAQVRVYFSHNSTSYTTRGELCREGEKKTW